jgi:hypothetical protein
MFGHMQDGVYKIPVGRLHIAPLARRAVFDPAELIFGDFHHRFHLVLPPKVN